MFLIKQLNENIKEFNPRQNLLFATSCCERLIPNYDAFVDREKCGDSKAAHAILDAFWNTFVKNETVHINILKSIRVCERLAPNTEKFSSVFVTPALCAIEALSSTLEYIGDNDIRNVLEVAQSAYDAVDNFAGMINDPILTPHIEADNFSDWIANSPLVTNELKCQEEDIQIIKQNINLDEAIVKAIRHKSRYSGIQPYLRGLLKTKKII